MDFSKSKALFDQAQKVIPGGVNSPVRAWRSVGSHPLFIAKANGSKIADVDGNKFIDYVMSWGPLILGHKNRKVMKSLIKAAEHGTTYGAPTELEVQMAELICSMIPSIQMVRMVSSGTEATMSAIRLARAYTKKSKIIKFEGCYHGHGDSFLIKAGSGAMTLGIPGSPGVPDDVAKLTLLAKYNDFESVQKVVNKHRGSIAALIIEPVAANIGLVLPEKNFLKQIRALCTKEKIVLIFDEVITGFRLAPGGAQEYYGVKSDLTTLGKIIGGGLPVGAYGGKREIMKMIAPSGDVYQAGTLSGNPAAMSAGMAVLSMLKNQPELYAEMEKKTTFLADNFKMIAENAVIPVQVHNLGSLLTVFFANEQVKDYQTALKADTERFGAYFMAMLQNGIYLPPSQFEAMFISAVHSDKDIAKTIIAFAKAMESLKS